MNPRLEGRNGEVYRRWAVYRETQEVLAERFGISQPRVSEIIAAVKATLPADDLAEMRATSLELYAELGRRAMEIADLAAAPVAVGKDGNVLFDPESGDVVRDYAARMKALELAAKMDGERRKLMGLDSATKVETSGTVRYELVGVDPEDLT